MAKVETISVALPPEMVAALKDAVAGGAYASPSEIVSEALRDWQQQRLGRDAQIKRLRADLDRAARNPERLTDEDVGAHFDKLFEAAVQKAAS
jgi:antitoxin ParD1/3/4